MDTEEDILLGIEALCDEIGRIFKKRRVSSGSKPDGLEGELEGVILELESRLKQWARMKTVRLSRS